MVQSRTSAKAGGRSFCPVGPAFHSAWQSGGSCAWMAACRLVEVFTFRVTGPEREISMSGPMTIQFQVSGFKYNDKLRRRVQTDLGKLNRLASATSARVLLSHQPGVATPCQVVAILSVVGPDIHAAARNHTWDAAWRKVLIRLREEIEKRRSRCGRRRADSAQTCVRAGPGRQ